MSALFLFIACLLFGITHFYSAIKSGCFYAVSRRDYNNRRLKSYIKNLHRVQTPFWYALFGGIFFACMSIFVKELHLNFQNTHLFWISIKKMAPSAFRSLIIAMSTSATFGTFYQGVINWGSGNSFIDKNEKKSFEIAFKYVSIWIPKFWYGRNRVFITIFAFVTLIYAIFFW